MFFCLPGEFRYAEFYRWSNAKGWLSAALKSIMKTIVVSGSGSGVGKTFLAEKLLRCLKSWSALKVTVTRDGSCFRKKSCGICAEIIGQFEIVKDAQIINQAGKDTWRLKRSGARQVIWLKAKAVGLRKGLFKALAEFSSCEGVVIEGTSVLKFIKPDINIHLAKRGEFKIC